MCVCAYCACTYPVGSLVSYVRIACVQPQQLLLPSFSLCVYFLVCCVCGVCVVYICNIYVCSIYTLYIMHILHTPLYADKINLHYCLVSITPPRSCVYIDPPHLAITPLGRRLRKRTGTDHRKPKQLQQLAWRSSFTTKWGCLAALESTSKVFRCLSNPVS